jgi:hypothetical protein
MAQVQAFTAATWRDEFNLFEMQFFSIAPEDWPIDSRKKIQELDQNYDATRHKIHVASLNALLRPFPLLEETDFDKKITLIALRETVLADRMQPTPASIVTLDIDISAKEIRDAGLGHLLREPKTSRRQRRRRRER